MAAGGINGGGSKGYLADLWSQWFAWYPVAVTYVRVSGQLGFGKHLQSHKPERVWFKKIWRRRVYTKVFHPNYKVKKNHWEYMREETLIEKTLRRFRATGITTSGKEG